MAYVSTTYKDEDEFYRQFWIGQLMKWLESFLATVMSNVFMLECMLYCGRRDGSVVSLSDLGP